MSLSPKEIAWKCLETVLIVTTMARQEMASNIEQVEARDAAKYPTNSQESPLPLPLGNKLSNSTLSRNPGICISIYRLSTCTGLQCAVFHSVGCIQKA